MTGPCMAGFGTHFFELLRSSVTYRTSSQVTPTYPGGGARREKMEIKSRLLLLLSLGREEKLDPTYEGLQYNLEPLAASRDSKVRQRDTKQDESLGLLLDT